MACPYYYSKLPKSFPRARECSGRYYGADCDTCTAQPPVPVPPHPESTPEQDWLHRF